MGPPSFSITNNPLSGCSVTQSQQSRRKLPASYNGDVPHLAALHCSYDYTNVQKWNRKRDLWSQQKGVVIHSSVFTWHLFLICKRVRRIQMC